LVIAIREIILINTEPITLIVAMATIAMAVYILRNFLRRMVRE